MNLATLLRPGVFLFALTVLPLRTEAQAPGPPPPPTDRPRVFLDCSFHCDFDHFRREIGFVDWVRERQDADVHVLGTSQDTGGGGREFTLAMIGLKELSGRQDTLTFFSTAAATDAETRDGLTRTLAMGLVRFAVRFPVVGRIKVTYTAPEGAEAQAQKPTHDPWNFWVFRTQVQGSFNGEQQQRAYSVNGGVNAGRVAERLKVAISARGNYRRSDYELDSVTTYVNTSKNYNHQILVVWSIGGHWSAGFRERAGKSTFVNQDLSVEAGAAMEYDVFPYRESTRRQVTFTYVLGGVYYNYEEETIFDRTRETRPLHLLNVAMSSRQPWGSVDMSLRATQYLHDLGRHRIDLDGGFNVRLVRGLQFNAFGEVSRIKDQLYLPKSGLSTEEILVQRRQLGTDYRYQLFAGLSYSFGSIFNNVVNPRMNEID